ncbi:MAG: methionine--tRNA ligase [Ignavibacteriales bacterium]|nr:MAG: methionine--tRNA ligase [Ignavibacteriaceae bacterium]MBW7872591.1 methionine--tRNA ligase [Ignavibacteria bacterium]MBZ0197461.1 methionine--tRNA ligase [Ignavibacteriaceae bacterium]MCZ2141856.1 methionine--tRNA ligase [Ignavibacteriales bacterium]WKZ73903.1 MAG: methionine--tRNA ligase [Ignavibacteriaceae bacterium]
MAFKKKFTVKILAKNKILVTAALPYANGPIHLGHLAGAYLPADIYVRYQRLRGTDIIFICGSDEHGVPITITADNEKVSPEVIIDRYHAINKQSFEKFGMSFDIYSRTSHPIHHKTAAEFFLDYYNSGLLVEKKSLQFYDTSRQMFLPDRYVEGTCPRCGNENARSDECENCGALYDPSELIDPVSKISGQRPELKETSHWFFPFGKFQERLESYIAEMDEKYGWKDNVLQYCKGWFSAGLQDRAITRDLDWGVKVPIPGFENKVLYVWFEAVLGYISATKELFKQRGEEETWRDYWQDPETKYVAFIGKDNIVFHALIFPAMLMAWNDLHSDDENFVLPQNIPANEFLNFEGKKFSKSRKWGIDVIDFLSHFKADSLRYTLTMNLPEYRDTDFSWKDFQAKHNNELADILGNFVNRTFTFIHKNFEGKVPALYTLSTRDEELLNQLEGYPQKIADLFEEYRFKDATLEIMNLARAGNKYFNDSEPWKTLKNDREKCSTTLHLCLQTIYTLGLLFMPVLPKSSEKILKMLGKRSVEWLHAGKLNLVEGESLGQPEILFRKIEDETIEEMKRKTAPEAEEEADFEKIDPISIDQFFETDLRVAQIVEAERVKKSEKLIKVQVSFGKERRQVIAGLGKAYEPEELIGKKVIVVANLKPAKLMGLESHGMMLAVDTPDGGLKVVEIDQSVNNGTKVR